MQPLHCFIVMSGSSCLANHLQEQKAHLLYDQNVLYSIAGFILYSPNHNS